MASPRVYGEWVVLSGKPRGALVHEQPAFIRASSSDIDRSAAAGPKAVNTYVPEGGSVDEAERRKLGEWLACGAPE